MNFNHYSDFVRNNLIAFLLLFSCISTVSAQEMRGSAEEAQAMVASAVEYYKQMGAEAALDKFTNAPRPEFREKDLYVFVVDVEEDRVVAHGTEPSRVGEPNLGLLDADGRDIGLAVLEAATPEGGWANYKYKNFSSGNIEKKKSWVVLHDGYIFGVGIYE